jgi:hypothetical protein
VTRPLPSARAGVELSSPKQDTPPSITRRTETPTTLRGSRVAAANDNTVPACVCSLLIGLVDSCNSKSCARPNTRPTVMRVEAQGFDLKLKTGAGTALFRFAKPLRNGGSDGLTHSKCYNRLGPHTRGFLPALTHAERGDVPLAEPRFVARCHTHVAALNSTPKLPYFIGCTE